MPRKTRLNSHAAMRPCSYNRNCFHLFTIYHWSNHRRLPIEESSIVHRLWSDIARLAQRAKLSPRLTRSKLYTEFVLFERAAVYGVRRPGAAFSAFVLRMKASVAEVNTKAAPGRSTPQASDWFSFCLVSCDFMDHSSDLYQCGVFRM